MSKKHYQLPYDDILDSDIDEWLNGLPRDRKGEFVRLALRLYINRGGSQIYTPIQPVTQTAATEQLAAEQDEIVKKSLADRVVEKPKKRPTVLSKK